MSLTTEQLLGRWSMPVPDGAPSLEFVLKENGEAEQRVDFGDGEPVSQKAVWRLDGDQRWVFSVLKNGKPNPIETTAFDVVEIDGEQMRYTNSDDDSIVSQLNRVWD